MESGPGIHEHKRFEILPPFQTLMHIAFSDKSKRRCESTCNNVYHPEIHNGNIQVLTKLFMRYIDSPVPKYYPENQEVKQGTFVTTQHSQKGNRLAVNKVQKLFE